MTMIFKIPYDSQGKLFSYWVLRKSVKIVSDEPFKRGDFLELQNISGDTIRTKRLDKLPKKTPCDGIGYFVTLPSIDKASHYNTDTLEEEESVAEILYNETTEDDYNKVGVMFVVFTEETTLKVKIEPSGETVDVLFTYNGQLTSYPKG
jgi:hypothetical protein